MSAAPLFCCVWVPEFPAQAMLRLRPAAARTPVAVLEGSAPTEAVCSVNRKAAQLGVAHGMTRAELESFVGITVLRRSVAEEEAAEAVLLELAGSWSPRVEILRRAAGRGNDRGMGLVLDMAGTERMFGPPEEFSVRLVRALRELRLAVRVAVSANFDTAVCLAPMAERRPVVVAAGEERRRLSALLLAALPLTPRQADVLGLWGIATAGALAELPERELTVRLGAEGARLRRLARGEAEHLMVLAEERFRLAETLEFDAPAELLEPLLFSVSSMLGQLLRRAAYRALSLRSVALTLVLEGGGEHRRAVTPALPSADHKALLKLIQLDLQAHPPGAAVLRLTVEAEPGERSEMQGGLFVPPLPEPMRLDVTLARIAALVGEGRVGRPQLLDSHRPESWAVERFRVPQNADADSASCREALGRAATAVALRRLRPAPEIVAEWRNDRLRSFWLRGTRYTVREAYGPWRRSGEWWSGEVWSREEWDLCAESETGARVLGVVGHDLLRDSWTLEGLYD